MSRFQKATKAQSKLRMAVFGPSGAGKTFSSLSIAKGLGGSVAVIDTEHGSASKYADRFDFDVVNLENKSIASTIEVIEEAGAANYNVLVIDSLSHSWQELLEDVDKLAQAKYKGNTWSAWSEGTPKQKKLVRAILSFSGHVIVTMRSKTEWSVQQNERGKNTPTRVGLAPEQGKGIEYEFDLLLELSTEHIGNVIKDRTGKFQDTLLEKPGEKFGRELAAWLSEGVAVTQAMAEQSLEDKPLWQLWKNPEEAKQWAAGLRHADGNLIFNQYKHAENGYEQHKKAYLEHCEASGEKPNPRKVYKAFYEYAIDKLNAPFAPIDDGLSADDFMNSGAN